MFAEPVEELRRALQLNAGQCVKLLKAIYGLAEAPRYCWKRLHTDLLALGFSDRVSEPCVYTMRGPSGELRGIAIAYVDDVMISFKPGDDLMEKQFVNVQALYEWGLLEAGDFKQTGGRVRQKYDFKKGQWGKIHLD